MILKIVLKMKIQELGMGKVKISIITVVYNGVDSIEGTALSVINQN